MNEKPTTKPQPYVESHATWSDYHGDERQKIWIRTIYSTAVLNKLTWKDQVGYKFQSAFVAFVVIEKMRLVLAEIRLVWLVGVS